MQKTKSLKDKIGEVSHISSRRRKAIRMVITLWQFEKRKKREKKLKSKKKYADYIYYSWIIQ